MPYLTHRLRLVTADCLQNSMSSFLSEYLSNQQSRACKANNADTDHDNLHGKWGELKRLLENGK